MTQLRPLSLFVLVAAVFGGSLWGADSTASQAGPPSGGPLQGPRSVLVRDLPRPAPDLDRAGPAPQSRVRRLPSYGARAAAQPAAGEANAPDPSFSDGRDVTSAAAPAVASGTFDALEDADNIALTGFSVSPPDPQMAVGPDHIVEMVNIVGRIYSRSGGGEQDFVLADFFGVPAGWLDTDPKIIYDALSGRWFASYVSLDDNLAGSDFGRLHIAVSQTSDPTGVWYVYYFPYTNIFPDYAAIGVTNDKVTLSSNLFDIDDSPVTAGCSSGYCGEQTIVIQKSELMAGAATPSNCGAGANLGVCFLPAAGPPFNANRFTVRPAHSLSSVSDQWLATFDMASFTNVTIIKITGTPDAGNVTEALALNRTILFQDSPPPSPTAGGGSIDSGDFRLLETVWRGGKLWAGASAVCGSTRSCAHLIEIDTAGPTVTQDIMFGSAGEYYSWPAVRTDASGDLYVSLTHTNSSIFAEARAIGRQASDPLNTISGSALLKAGQVIHNSGRWGDYLGAAVDPQQPECVWLVGEYARNSSGSDWGTFIAGASYGDLCDTDREGFPDSVEDYLGTDPKDNCPDNPSDDAHPLDLNMNAIINVLDVLRYKGVIPAVVTTPELQRMDLNVSSVVNVTDVAFYKGKIPTACE